MFQYAAVIFSLPPIFSLIAATIILAKQIKGSVGSAIPYVLANEAFVGVVFVIAVYYYDLRSPRFVVIGICAVIIAALLGVAQYALGKVAARHASKILTRTAGGIGVILLAVIVAALAGIPLLLLAFAAAL
jgi:hypothetical protein